MRIIPKKTKIKVEFYKNISLVDMIIGFIGMFIEILLFLSNFEGIKYVMMAFVLGLFICLYLPVDGQKMYLQMVNWVKYLVKRKKYESGSLDSSADIKELIPYRAISGGFIEYDGYYAGVLEIRPKEFRLLSNYKQNELIDKVFGSVIKSINGKTVASLVKVDRPILLDSYIEAEKKKKDSLEKTLESGGMTYDETVTRKNIIDNRTEILENLNTTDRILRSAYYLVVYDSSTSVISEILDSARERFAEYAMSSSRLNDKELAVFLKYNYSQDFDERDIEYLEPDEYLTFAMPSTVEFGFGKCKVDGREQTVFTVRDYPVAVGNAWGYKLFNIEGTKVVMNIMPVEKSRAVRRIDRALQEILSKSQNSFKASDLIDQQTHIDSLVELLTMLQNDNENLYEVTIHLTVYNDSADAKNSLKKKVKTILAEDGFKVSENTARQMPAFVASNLSAADTVKEYYRSIHSTSVAAAFPFVLNYVMDDKGVFLGEANGFPVIIDFFKRDHERVNSNMVIMGKSGSGKSYATKTVLSHLAAENSKIFILDPENEYRELSYSLGGTVIDVGTAKEGRLNPFHIMTTLEADESDGVNSNYSVHLQFLEEFFKQILQGISSDALEYLNNIVLKVYEKKGITHKTDLSALSASDYPTFDDLYSEILEQQRDAKAEYDIQNLRILNNYVAKFAGDGRNANLWCGENSLSVKENFAVFNFQSLLANKNNTIANAQMLLVLKWLDNEIIKNRDFNIKHGTDRKIIVVIDEAHVFIDTKYPIALDFMFQLAKRIRKYNGMQIVITQNIKDFVGSPEIARKSTAIINACQYSLIFALSPNDMGDLCTLYEKAGEINETEQEDIINNARGSAFVITGPLSRTGMSVIASDYLASLFGG